MTRVILLSLASLVAAGVALVWLDGPVEVLVYEVALIVVAVAWWRRIAAATPAVAPFRKPRLTSQRTIPSSLARIERVVAFASSGFEAEHRLLPLLRRLARDRLASAHGVDIELQPDKAETLLGPETWALVGPGDDESRATVPLDRIERAVTALERL